MDTLRLRTLQQPSMVEGFLVAIVQKMALVPRDAVRVCDRSELPSRHHKLAGRSSEESAWAAWSTPDRIWFYTAEMSLESSRERGTPVVQVKSYNDRATLLDVTTWTRDARGDWLLTLT